MKTKVLIVGSGPYGIGLAHYLHSLKVPYKIVGKPFELWFEHTIDSMKVRSDRHSSEIFTLENLYPVSGFIKERYPQEADKILRDRLPVSVFRSYLQDILKRMPVNITDDLVKSVTRTEDGFLSTLNSGEEIESEAVVIAVGVSNHRYLPPSIKKMEGGLVQHGYFVREYCSWNDKDVLVIGSGQSAAEAVQVLAAQNNRVTSVMRKPPVYYSEPINLPRFVFNIFLRLSPVFYFFPMFLKKLLGNKFVEVTVTPDMKPVFDNKNVEVLCEDAESLELSLKEGKVHSVKLNRSFDGLVSATGYKYDLNSLPFLGKDILNKLEKRNGTPLVDFSFKCSIPNLFFTGGICEPVFGPAQRFIFGNRFASLKLGDTLSKI